MEYVSRRRAIFLKSRTAITRIGDTFEVLIIFQANEPMNANRPVRSPSAA